MKIRYTKLRDHIIMITLLYEKTLEKSMKDKKLDPIELDEFKKIYNHYLDKRKEIMKNTKFDVKDVFGDIIGKDTISPEQITKLNNFLAKNDVNININFKLNIFKPKKDKQKLYESTAPPLPIYDDL